MTCYHPIKAFVLGTKPDGKKVLKFVNKEQRDFEELWIGNRKLTEYVLLPCGKCIGCTIKRSRDWATRMMLELKYHERACFVTLTYNDENLPTSSYVDYNGEEKLSFTLKKRDFQLFMKRLRKYYGETKIRFFGCGEYGTKSKRPHYHVILFGVDFHEDRFVHEVRDGNVTYRSPALEKIWPYGYSLIAEVNWNTCAYVSRYCTKKYASKQNIYYQTFNIEPEFNLMSRRPGIACQFYQEHKDEVYINQEIFMQNNNGGFKARPPSYFDRLYDVDNPAEMEKIKQARKEIAENEQRLKVERSSLNYFELLEAEEKAFKDRISTLKRDKV